MRAQFQWRPRKSLRAHVLGERLFRDALARERKRADRSGQPFAVLAIDWGTMVSGRDPSGAILRAVVEDKRGQDVVGWLRHPDLLGLLMPDASSRGAVAAMHRLRRDFSARFDGATLAAPAVRVYSHSGDGASEAPDLRDVGVLMESLGQHPRGQAWRTGAKRALDVVGSLLLLALFAPALLLIVAIVKASSPGPIIFRQVRIGQGGRPFTMFKFRTMYVSGDEQIHQDYMTWFIKSSARHRRNGDEVFKLTNDPRITRAGHFLRRSSLDELPQFWNVLRGDMSLVGPRPPLPFEVEQYQRWHRRRVIEAKPGVTGPWQVNGRSRTSFDDMVRLDLRYARSLSLWTDIKILAATPRAMVSGKGAC